LKIEVIVFVENGNLNWFIVEFFDEFNSCKASTDDNKMWSLHTLIMIFHISATDFLRCKGWVIKMSYASLISPNFLIIGNW
jgi:hypothetical protein